jgi:hypothetical protein
MNPKDIEERINFIKEILESNVYDINILESFDEELVELENQIKTLSSK